jgi:hypothetical protein
MNKALDEVRFAESRRVQREGCEPILKKSRWLLEAVEDIERFRALFADTLKIRLPLSEQTNAIREITSSPMAVKNP